MSGTITNISDSCTVIMIKKDPESPKYLSKRLTIYEIITLYELKEGHIYVLFKFSFFYFFDTLYAHHAHWSL